MSRHTLVWLITGASTGLGLALTKRILARGDRVVATARNISRFDELLADAETDRARIHVLALDVTWSFAALQEVMKDAVGHWGRIDVLVNNAAIGGEVGPSEELGLEWMMKVMQTNYGGVVNVTNTALPHLRAQREGTIVIIGSRGVYRNEFLGPAYTSSKAAVHAYGETLSAELAPFNIRVLIVAPGQFKTELSHPILGTPIADYDAARDTLRKQVEWSKHVPGQGDPAKGMDALVDVVRGEGRAAEHAGTLPLWLVLGKDAIPDVKARAKRLADAAEEWKDVSEGLTVDDAK